MIYHTSNQQANQAASKSATSQPTSNQPANPANQPANPPTSQPTHQPAINPPTSQPAASGEGECFLPCKSGQNGGVPMCVFHRCFVCAETIMKMRSKLHGLIWTFWCGGKPTMKSTFHFFVDLICFYTMYSLIAILS